MRLTTLLLLCSALLMSACSSTGEYDDETYGMSVSELYDEAKAKLSSGEYETAAQYYEKLESRFPYGPYAERARLEIAYAYYKDNQPESAILAAERFIKLHPNHPHVDYAYYIRGLASFDNTRSFLDKLFDQDPAERDPKSVRQAFSHFAELVQKFPKSRYTPDAIKRMKELRENLARYEVYVASYYEKKAAYLAAANRAKYVVENYQGTEAVPDALAVMVEAYESLGMHDLATDAMRVLELNHPDHEKTKTLKKSLKQ